MRIATVISLIGLLAMTVVILYAFVFGDFASEGAWITSHPWGIVSLVDLYVGFAIFSLWIAYREKSLISTLIWIVLMIVLGNWTAAFYLLLALRDSKGDWKLFWMGSRAH